LRDWRLGRETLADRRRPVEARRRSFTVSAYSEPRLCRYRAGMQWAANSSFPFNAGLVARARLPIRHYPHRDPIQMERRCRLRALMMADSINTKDWLEPERHHWAQQDWRTVVVSETLPGLQEWTPGAELPQPTDCSHISPWPKRAAQRIVHAALLPLFD